MARPSAGASIFESDRARIETRSELGAQDGCRGRDCGAGRALRGGRLGAREVLRRRFGQASVRLCRQNLKRSEDEMSRMSSAEEIRERMVAAMGGDAGEIFHSLQQRTIQVLETWHILVSLYGAGAARIALLQDTDEDFFYLLLHSLKMHVRLQLATLLDTAATGGRRNASLDGFLEVAAAVLPIALRDQIAVNVETVRRLFEKSGLRNARNQLIAHTDLETIKGARSVVGDGLDNEELAELFRSLTGVLNEVESHFLRSRMVYDLVPAGHAAGLVGRLERAQRASREARGDW